MLAKFPKLPAAAGDTYTVSGIVCAHDQKGKERGQCSIDVDVRMVPPFNYAHCGRRLWEELCGIVMLSTLGYLAA